MEYIFEQESLSKRISYYGNYRDEKLHSFNKMDKHKEIELIWKRCSVQGNVPLRIGTLRKFDVGSGTDGRYIYLYSL